MFSKACEYGIRALTIIAKEGAKGRKLGIKDICKAANTPESFTAKILQNLVKRGILSSQKGPSGGFFIVKELSEITIYDIVEAIDGVAIFHKCGLGLSECNAKKPCPLHNQFEVVRDELKEMCHNNTLENLVSDLKIEAYLR